MDQTEYTPDPKWPVCVTCRFFVVKRESTSDIHGGISIVRYSCPEKRPTISKKLRPGGHCEEWKGKKE